MKLILYMLRWQLSTPILFVVIYFLRFDTLTETIIANLIGSLIFYQVDKFIFNRQTIKAQQN